MTTPSDPHHEKTCLAEIWTLMQIYRSGGALTLDELRILEDVLPCPQVILALDVTEQEIRDVRIKVYLAS